MTTGFSYFFVEGEEHHANAKFIIRQGPKPLGCSCKTLISNTEFEEARMDKFLMNGNQNTCSSVTTYNYWSPIQTYTI